MTSRALSVLAAFASPVFIVAAIAGWLTGFWPANPVTLGISAFLVLGGPLLGIVHVVSADEYEPEPEPVVALPRAVVAPRPVPAPVPEPLLLTPRAAAARRFAAWRDQSHPALEKRERERRASRYARG